MSTAAGSTTTSDGTSASSTTSSATAASTLDIGTSFFNDQKPLQSYLYPTLSFVIVILIAIHACRFFERRRARRRRAFGLDSFGEVHDEVGEDSGPVVKLVRPRIFDVYLDSKGVKNVDGRVEWSKMMPLSSNIFVYVDETDLAARAHPGTHAQPWLSDDARQNYRLLVDVVMSAIRHIPELFSLYNRRAEREMQERNRTRRSNAAAVNASDDPHQGLLDTNLPRELVTGVMILMPSAVSPRAAVVCAGNWEEEQLPDVAIGVKDKDWNGRIDV